MSKTISELEIVSVLNDKNQVVMRHTKSLGNYYQAMSKFQEANESFSASSKNPHFKNDFAPLPKMLTAVNNGYREQGLCQTKHIAEDYLVTRTYHIVTGEFMEVWTKLPAIDADINKYKGVVTSVDRYVTSKEANIGSEKDVDNADTNSESSFNVSSTAKFNPMVPKK
jgi:hypothetical protein